MKYAALLLFVAVLSLVGCKHDYDAPANPGDSVLTKTAPAVVVDTSAVMKDTNGLVIDRTRLRAPEHEKLLNRFAPKDVRAIYTAFWPMRKAELTHVSVEGFLAEHRLTLDELKAILEEGDMLGWADALKASGPTPTDQKK